MNGEDIPPRPSKPRAASGSRGAAAQAPAWGGVQQKPAAATPSAPLWQRPAEPSAPTAQPTPSAATPVAKPAGPAWLNG